MTTDGPDAVQDPATQADWLALHVFGIRVPAFSNRCQDLLGNLRDDVQDGTIGQLTAGAGLTYAQALAGWAQKFVRTSEVAAGGAGRLAGALWNNYRQSIAKLIYFQLNACGGNRVFATINGGTRYVQCNPAGRLQLIDGILGEIVTSAHNYLDGAVHPVYIECIAGATIPGSAGPGIWRLTTDYEQIVGTWARRNDDVKGIAGAGSIGTSPDCYYGRNDDWIGADAEAHAAMGGKLFLQSLGWTVRF